MRKVLVLGAGLVSRPLVQYLLKYPDFTVTVASRTVSKAKKLVENHDRGNAIEWQVSQEDELKKLISEHDLAISLLPYTYHTKVARLCIEFKKHLITTSYVSNDMQSLDSAAKEAGILLLNEIGLDPGIDHMSAKRIIDAVHKKNGKVLSFSSYCGGLPAPDANDNPFGYKFSWSPRGVVMAGMNNARFMKNGEEVNIPGKELFDHYEMVDIENLNQFEGYPNRDSVPYVETYAIPETNTMFRGTLRNIGWCSTWKKIADLGLLNLEERSDLKDMTLAEYVAKVMGVDSADNIRDQVAKRLKLKSDSDILDRLEWLGLFSDEPISENQTTYLDVLAARLLQKMEYKPGEKDMIVLHHEFNAYYPSTRKKERITSTLIDYGIPYGDSAMSRTVSLPAAIGARFILEGKITGSGVMIPVLPSIYNPVLDELVKLNIKCIDIVTNL
ncbi:MAG: saccharopine dehydrogenase [Candidatus Schekmanbacteria bacterium RBG_13_48_7]|uniref:Saccharopine dehydrogenase n=1 Tax=Candidatus Schekmanbacteria bacterium RBG_13_48_7 TaxID=1817878 RepID=A0A1F7RYN7_9BACT|nr:MAG: saccharopine dehydrogenase [Candidatus Schekmanbacteria bacterium RBG_13_48_7]